MLNCLYTSSFIHMSRKCNFPYKTLPSVLDSKFGISKNMFIFIYLKSHHEFIFLICTFYSDLQKNYIINKCWLKTSLNYNCRTQSNMVLFYENISNSYSLDNKLYLNPKFAGIK